MKFMVFDVESVGLHGEAFAVGWVVFDISDARILNETRLWVDDRFARGSQDDRKWVQANVPEMSGAEQPTLRSMRDSFWRGWMHWKERGAQLAADCTWPVEANFLSACVADDPLIRAWQGPYPFYDIASILLAKGMDPLKSYDRLPSELPIHDPLNDAKQSARLLIEAWRI